MKIPRIRAAVAVLVVVASGGVLAQSSVAPKAIPPTSVVPQVKELREAVQLVELPKEIVIKGQHLHDSYFVGAEVLVFEAGATLVFSEKAFRERNNLIVAAKEVVMRDPGRPGRITWARSITPEGVAPASGQAPSGASGHGDGVPGQPGQAGVAGITGLSGRNAPNLTLFVTKIKGAPPTIDLLGQRGGQGGMGQRGGDGGHGHKGSPASASAFDCRSGAGYGGHGGPGGAGGTGGRGGEGGAGGTVTLVSLPDAFPALLQLVRVDVSGGAGGAGGDPGKGGPGGRGGAQGEKALPYCKDEPGRRGSDAAAGPDGGAGPTGAQGPQGDVVYTTLKKEVFETLFGAL